MGRGGDSSPLPPGSPLSLSRLGAGAVMMQVSSSSGWQWSAFKVWFDSHPASLSLSLSVSPLCISLYLPLCWLPFLSRPLLSPCLPNRPLSISPSLLFSLLPCLPLSPCLFSVPRPLSSLFSHLPFCPISSSPQHPFSSSNPRSDTVLFSPPLAKKPEVRPIAA